MSYPAGTNAMVMTRSSGLIIGSLRRSVIRSRSSHPICEIAAHLRASLHCEWITFGKYLASWRVFLQIAKHGALPGFRECKSALHLRSVFVATTALHVSGCHSLPCMSLCIYADPSELLATFCRGRLATCNQALIEKRQYFWNRVER